jgi:hypothetical protein
MSSINAQIHALGLVDASGTRIPALNDVTNGWGVVIPSAATYYMELGSNFGNLISETQDQSLSLKWNAALAAVATFEVTNFPPVLGGLIAGAPDVTVFDTSASWQQFNPATSSSLAYTVASGAGNSWTNLTLTLGGSNAGGAYANMPGTTMRRMRMKLVVTAAGFLRAVSWGKIAA